MLRDELSSDLGRSIYDYSSISKLECPPEIMEELARAFCIRENLKFISISPDPLNIGTVIIMAEESLYLHSKWYVAFSDHGYSAPFLWVDTIQQ